MRRLALIALVVASSSTAHAKPDPIAALVEAQTGGFVPMGGDDSVPADVYVDGAVFSMVGNNDVGKVGPDQLPDAIIGPCFPKEHTVKQLHATMSADGKAAAISFAAEFNSKCDVSGELFFMGVRASEVAVKTSAGWRIAGGEWSVAQANKAVNDAAIAGKLSALDAVADDDGGDKDVRAAFASLVADGVDAAGAARKDLVSIGSGPGERSTTGAALAKPWKAAWVGHVDVKGHIRVETAPSGTTAWVTANVTLGKHKGGVGYAIPFRVFFVFDKVASGWSLVHAHFAVPIP